MPIYSANSKPYSVTQINKYLKAVMDDDCVLENIKIAGEISNFKRNISGHVYFTLKDAESAISCVAFSEDYERLADSGAPIADGLNAVVSGKISVYVKTGQYQIYVRKIEREGRGELFERLEELKRRLKAEGLFDLERKKRLPERPERIAVITSPHGAAVKDIISVARRRNKAVNIVIFPVTVQGDGAALEIAEAIYDCNSLKAADVIIVGRGGGSVEDLWAFNEEVLVRAVCESEIPVISAVGHETDITLADFAADVRAATPSVSAEIAVPIVENRKYILKKSIVRLNSAIDSLIDERRRKLQYVSEIVEVVSPLGVMRRGYSITVDEGGNSVKSVCETRAGDVITTIVNDGEIISKIIETRAKNE